MPDFPSLIKTVPDSRNGCRDSLVRHSPVYRGPGVPFGDSVAHGAPSRVRAGRVSHRACRSLSTGCSTAGDRSVRQSQPLSRQRGWSLLLSGLLPKRHDRAGGRLCYIVFLLPEVRLRAARNGASMLVPSPSEERRPVFFHFCLFLSLNGSFFVRYECSVVGRGGSQTALTVPFAVCFSWRIDKWSISLDFSPILNSLFI